MGIGDYTPLRWSIARMEGEFGIGNVTLAQRLSDLGIEPEADGCYSGQQVRLLLEKGGGINRARLLKMEAETELAKARTAVIDREYLPREKLELALLTVYGHTRRIIERSPLPERDKVSIYKLLGASPEALMRGEGGPGDDYSEVQGSEKRHKRTKSNRRRGNGVRRGDPCEGMGGTRTVDAGPVG